jgi:hypothetical protein
LELSVDWKSVGFIAIEDATAMRRFLKSALFFAALTGVAGTASAQGIPIPNGPFGPMVGNAQVIMNPQFLPKKMRLALQAVFKGQFGQDIYWCVSEVNFDSIGTDNITHMFNDLSARLNDRFLLAKASVLESGGPAAENDLVVPGPPMGNSGFWFGPYPYLILLGNDPYNVWQGGCPITGYTPNVPMWWTLMLKSLRLCLSDAAAIANHPAVDRNGGNLLCPKNQLKLIAPSISSL